jgi:hypothetical protein
MNDKKIDLHAGLRDAPKPAHAVPSGCLAAGTVDQDGYCTSCGEKAVRGPISFVMGLKK